jgi:hypothetical protein
MAFTTTDVYEDISFQDHMHQAALDDDESFCNVYDDRPPEVVQQLLNIAHHSGKSNVKVIACEWLERECKQSHLLRDCPVFQSKKLR